MAEQNKFLLVDLSVLPEVFTKVVEAKRYMAQGKAKSYSDAAKMAGISRSAFYKYKDKVYPYESNSLTLGAHPYGDTGGLAGYSLLAHHRIVSDRGKHHHHQPEYPCGRRGAGIGIAAHRPGTGR